MRTAAPPPPDRPARLASPRTPPLVRRPRLARLVGLCVLCALVLPLPATFGAQPPAAVRDTAEWHRTTDLWHAMLDHSSNLIYSPARFQAMVSQMDTMDADIQALADRKLLSPHLADALRALCHDRYQYLQARHYTTESSVTLSATEAAAAAAHWVVELQLALLRREAARPEPDRAIMSGAESTIAYELSFLRQHDRFEAEAARRRLELAARQADGQRVDFEAFDNDCQRRRNLLLDAYRARRIRLSPAVRALMPYVIALTVARPPSLVESRDSSSEF